MKKKLAIIGRGTAGALSAAHFHAYAKDWEIDWYYDPSKPVQAVGEGSQLTLPAALHRAFEFSHLDLPLVDGSFKAGIEKHGWGLDGERFIHNFTPPTVAYHFNAVGLQNYILDKLSSKVRIIEANANSDTVDADFVMDCTGKPSDYTDFNRSEYIPVNSVYVTQCYWDYPRFQHTLTLARPYGWVFGIPLQNRCSIGYLYNNSINSLDEVKEDVKNIFDQYALTPSENTNAFSFNNYFRSKTITPRIAYNGNASFFLEPLEATSIGVMDMVYRHAWDVWNGLSTCDFANENYISILSKIETFIMMHYYAGSMYKTPFWDFAEERGRRCIENAIITDDAFVRMCKLSNLYSSTKYIHEKHSDLIYGTWWLGSFIENISGLKIRHDLNTLIEKHGR